MKITFYLFYFISIWGLSTVGCPPQTREPVVLTYGPVCEQIEKDIEIVDIKQFPSYDSLFQKCQDITCDNKSPVFEISNGNIIKRIKPVSVCWEETACVLIKMRNVLKIVDDSIVRPDQNYDLTHLDHFVNLHSNNCGVDHTFSDHPRKTLISIKYKDQPLTTLPILLDKITLAYDKLDLEWPLQIMLERNFPPPPPPPPSPNLEEDQTKGN